MTGNGTYVYYMRYNSTFPTTYSDNATFVVSGIDGGSPASYSLGGLSVANQTSTADRHCHRSRP